ncbi:MAG: CHRD domain-containing protein [Phycisphaerales bacterium]|nr:CHRD domain-containing protein [Phycisphaerales bacterium]
MKYSTLVTLAVAPLAVATVAQGSIVTIRDIAIDGLQPVDPTFSTGTGNATVVINTDTRFVEISGTFEGLTSTVIGAHLHGPADFGEFSPRVILPLEFVGDTSGSFSAARTVSPTNLGYILDSLSYINIHTNNHPSGEIRGQVVVPSPGSAGLLLLLPAFATRRSRR